MVIAYLSSMFVILRYCFKVDWTNFQDFDLIFFDSFEVKN